MFSLKVFEGEEAVLHVIERIVGPLGLRVEESSPGVDARLSDGSLGQTRFLRAIFCPDPHESKMLAKVA
jgi:Flp pilus assembly CpaF family ATPase